VPIQHKLRVKLTRDMALLLAHVVFKRGARESYGVRRSLEKLKARSSRRFHRTPHVALHWPRFFFSLPKGSDD
jgi:hypothetical protein